MKFTITIKGETEDTAQLSKAAAQFAHKIGAKEAKIKYPEVARVATKP